MSERSEPTGTTGVVVMAYGTPATPADVEAYYTHIRRGRAPTAELVEDLRSRYDAIGGISPLRRITEAQCRRLAVALDGGWRVALGQKHAAPFIEDAVAELADAGVASLVGLVLAPHYSRGSVGEYLARLAAAATQHRLAVTALERWHDLEAWRRFQAETMVASLARLPGRTKVLFSAHSLPEEVLVDDPYPDELQASASAIAAAVGLVPQSGWGQSGWGQSGWGLAWQSAGRTAARWRGPDILAVIDDLAATGQFDGVLVCPQGFTADHLEVLYDLDVAAQERAAGHGLAFARTASLNDDAAVFAALADRVRAAAAGASPIPRQTVGPGPHVLSRDAGVRIVVVGGGITGLAAAFELRRRAPDAELTLLEATDRLGGKILTTHFAGRPLDAGADAFLARVPAAVELCAELGLADELVSPAERGAYLFSRGALHRLPDGLVIGVPTDLAAAARGGILTGPVSSVPCRPLAPGADVAVGALIRECFGDEVAARLIDPLLGGINAGDSDRLSVRATAPLLAHAAEHVGEHGGDLAAALGAARAAAPGGAHDPIFLTHPGGLGRVIDSLAAALDGTRIDLGTAALALAPAPAGGWELTTPSGQVLADGVVLTAPAFVTAALVRDLAPGAARLLDDIAYASVALVTFSFDPGALATPLDASGFLVPRAEGLHLTACSWSSRKWAHLHDGPVIVRASAGRIDDRRALDLDDADLVEQLLGDLDATMGVRNGPTGARVSRWERSFPQYAPGHLDRVAAMEADVAARAPGVVVAGAAQRGLGVPACIAQGRGAARALVDVLYARRRSGTTPG